MPITDLDPLPQDDVAFIQIVSSTALAGDLRLPAIPVWLPGQRLRRILAALACIFSAYTGRLWMLAAVHISGFLSKKGFSLCDWSGCSESLQ